MKLSKNTFYKSWAPKLIFSNKNFFRKIRIIFDIEKWLWKSEFCNLAGLITSTKNVQKIFQSHFCDQFEKFLSNSSDMVKILLGLRPSFFLIDRRVYLQIKLWPTNIKFSGDDLIHRTFFWYFQIYPGSWDVYIMLAPIQ